VLREDPVFLAALAAALQPLGVDTLIFTGFCAEYCVLATYRGAEDLDLRHYQ
jgi:nicotinamidase-related amidase